MIDVDVPSVLKVEIMSYSKHVIISSLWLERVYGWKALAGRGGTHATRRPPPGCGCSAGRSFSHAA